MKTDRNGTMEFNGYSVLLVDEDIHFIQNLRKELEAYRIINIVECMDRSKIISKISKKNYSLILLDITSISNSDELNIYDPIFRDYSGIKVVTLSKDSKVEIVTDFKHLGAFDHYKKENAISELVNKIITALNEIQPNSLMFINKNVIDGEVEKIIPELANELERIRYRKTANKTIFFADLVDSTKFKDMDGHENGMKRINYHNALAKVIINKYNGEVVKFIGDEVFAVFDKPKDAVIAAIIFKSALSSIDEFKKTPLQTRIGLTYGQVELISDNKNKDYVGLEVDKAARILQIAKSGQILVDKKAIDLFHISFQRMPFIKSIILEKNKKLKGIKDPITIYRIMTETDEIDSIE